MMKTFENTLFLEMRGCNFWEDSKEAILSDVGNYRVGSYNNSIIGKDGITYIVEFGKYDRYTYRKTNKRTGAPLKKEVRELVKECALRIDTQYDTPDGLSYRNSKLEKEISDLLLSYTKENILKAINIISKIQYDNIVLLWDAKIENILQSVYNAGGYREKAIIENLERVDKKQYDKNYYVVTFISKNGDSFDYEMNSGRITG